MKPAPFEKIRPFCRRYFLARNRGCQTKFKRASRSLRCSSAGRRQLWASTLELAQARRIACVLEPRELAVVVAKTTRLPPKRSVRRKSTWQLETASLRKVIRCKSRLRNSLPRFHSCHERRLDRKSVV